jgi:phenylalanyl-tRNA synthetase beta chain
MSADQSRLRITLLGSLLDVAQRNRARGSSRLALFESGAVYLPRDGEAPAEPHHLGALLCGPVRPATWRSPNPPQADFFAAKGVLAGLLDTVRVPWSVEAAGDEAEPFLHPGASAWVLLDGARAGWLGEVHPSVAARWEIEDPVAAFELDLDAVAQLTSTPQYRDLSSVPEVREDLAVVVSDSITAAAVLAVARKAGGALLSAVEVFDVYRDADRIGPGNVSLALRLHFRAPDRTLTDEEVGARRRKIAAALSEQLQGRVRDS